MSTVSYEHIREARALLSKYLSQTRLQAAPSLSRIASAEVALKLESEQPTGSFKVRGALYALAVNSQRRKIAQVVTASTGNHGAAVAYAAFLLRVPCIVFLPDNPNPTKRSRIVEQGASVKEAGRNLFEAAVLAAAYAKREGMYFLNDATDPDLPAGPATIACEILEQRPETDTIIVPVGDTAFIRGIAAAVRHLRPEVRIVGVQAEGAPAYYQSWKTGKVPALNPVSTIADGLAPQAPVLTNVEQIRRLIDDFCLVSDDEMLCAMRHLILEEHVLSEPAGAAATAALIYCRASKFGKRPTAIVSGANISPQVLRLMCGTSDLGSG
ncbi:MAG TPA: pyridoxal-phosphate dependent enzyme [Candidatus Acidoferrales bacterium]|nr:pyridoxal-phosphate dependent enzyme [Candidatus Acidoferrales bacterium]